MKIDYNLLFEISNSSGDAFQVADESGRLVYINEEASRRLGIPKEEATNYYVPDFEKVFGDRNSLKWQAHVQELKEKKIIKVDGINVNKKTGNKFPVEVIVNYEGDKPVTTQLLISSRGKTVFRKRVQFSSTKKSATITDNLTSNKEGLQYYSASISEIENEKNTKNNSKSFSVEVIDEQTKVLLLTSVLHPDIGAFKKSIESNKQRSVDVNNINNFNDQINDYQLIILYNPNNKFNAIFNQIKQNNSNFLLVSGANTNWNFINNKQFGFQKNAINQTENYRAFYNDSFFTFLQEDIGFNNYPPLKDKFGEVHFSKEHKTLLYQNINGLQTQQPLLATFDVCYKNIRQVFRFRHTS